MSETDQPSSTNGLPVLPDDLLISTLGQAAMASPACRDDPSESGTCWLANHDRILLDDHLDSVRVAMASDIDPPSIELAGPRRLLYFQPSATRIAIVTCGGLCPGINDVIRAIVMHAWHTYGVRRLLGIPFGYEGLNPDCGHEPIELTPESVMNIASFGGSMLGTSRGKQDVGTMVSRLESLGVQILFVIGGDGSQRGALAIHQEITARGAEIAIIGVPKTIDNDILFMDRSFGYQTAFAMAYHAVKSAHTEARGCRNGVGLVKLMGRDSGFIACSAALATGDANFVLIPEVPFALHGATGLLARIRERLANRGHVLIIAAEGAGQEHILQNDDMPEKRDASGNRLHADIGQFLKQAIADDCRDHGIEANLKYIDPSYLIRSVPAAPEDRVFCLNLGRHAVHAGMAGKTGMVIARWHHRYVHLPMTLVARGRRKVEPQGDFWRSVLESTGQPARIG
jgi:6-phosphofructokinase 1